MQVERMKVAPVAAAYADAGQHKLIVEFAIPGAPTETVDVKVLKDSVHIETFDCVEFWMPWIDWIRRFVDVRVARGEKESIHDLAGVLPKVDLVTVRSTDDLVLCVTEDLCLLVETRFVGALEVVQQRVHRVVEINQLLVQIFDDMSALNVKLREAYFMVFGEAVQFGPLSIENALCPDSAEP